MGSFKAVILFLVVIFSLEIHAQEHFVIYFSDKQGAEHHFSDSLTFLSQAAVDRRVKYDIPIDSLDLPVPINYTETVKTSGAEIVQVSKWLNAAHIVTDSATLSDILEFPFVRGGTHVHRKSSKIRDTPSPFRSASYGNSLTQNQMLELDQMHSLGYTGKGVLIAVLDAGFRNVSSLSVFDTVFNNDQVVATRDFVDNEKDVYDDDYHGTQVLSILSGYKEGELIGSGYGADLLLLRTEDVAVEDLHEEFNWVVAAEYADSAGADIISSSIGYNWFDNDAHSHSYSDLDGETSIISRGAGTATEKGIFVINSAGNEGATWWEHILVPGDAESVLTVGAVNSSGAYESFSSKGPTADGRIKPDVVALGRNVVLSNSSGAITTSTGTSYAAPLVTGLVAGLIQSFPDSRPEEIREAVRASGDQSASPDNLRGYGIPAFIKASSFLLGYKPLTNEGIHVFPNPFSGSFTIKSDRGAKVDFVLTDMSGREVHSGSLEGHSRLVINSSSLQPGIYFIKLRTGDITRTVKLLCIN